MTEENKDQIADGGEATTETTGVQVEPSHEHAHEHEHGHEHGHEHEEVDKAIKIELEDLTEAGKAKAEKALHRAIADLPYTLASQEARPGSVVGLKFEVAREAFEAEQNRLLNDIRKEAVLPGFRKGKVPVKLLQLRLGEDVVRDAVRSAATNVLRQEHAKQSFGFIDKPVVLKHEVPASGAVTFEIEGEVEPQIEAKQYKGLAVEVEVRPVTEAMVDEKLDALRRQNAVLEAAPADVTVGAEDQIIADVAVINDKGERMVNLSKDGRLLYNYKQELPQPVAEQLEGKKVGETVSAPVESSTTNRRGEAVTHVDTYNVTVREIKISKLPTLDDEFAKDLGDYATLADLRAKTLKDLDEAEAQRQRNESLAQLYHQLLVLNPVDAPRSLLGQQAYKLIMDDQYQLSRMGLRLENVVQDADKYLADQRASAEEMVKIQLLLDQVAKNENLTVSDEDVEKDIQDLAEKTGRKPLAIRARLEAQKQLDQFRTEVGRRKLADFLLANNTVNLVPMREKAATAESETDANTTEV